MNANLLKRSSPTNGKLSASVESHSDTEDQEISDDDDRNHKHLKRESGPHSFDNNSQEQPIRRASRKRKDFANCQMFHNDQSTNLLRETFEKRRPMLMTKTRFPSDSGIHGRVNQEFHIDPGPCFDMFASTSHPRAGRGRGRNTSSWAQHDSRFNPLDSVEFKSQIASQDHHGLFIGTALSGTANMQTAPWGAYSFIPGMISRIVDPLHQVRLQALQPRTTLMNSGMPRQRCRDFEERGFCLLGDMCPMEHGINRIVVEDVQSLSQFNLPTAAPSAHPVGVQVGAGTLPSTSTPAILMTGSKPVTGKDDMMPDVLEAEAVSTASGYVEADVYDPDKPLWINECPETSNVRPRLPLPDDDEQHLIADSSTGKSQQNGVQSENLTKNFLKDVGPQGYNSSFLGRIGCGNQSDTERSSRAASSKSDVEFETKEDYTESALDTAGVSQGKHDDNKEFMSKTISMQPPHRPSLGSGHSGGKSKASRTLYVQGIPQQSNKNEMLLSHFQKFGKVVHIHIPLNREIAFVEFSKKEEAEAALKAPDAVMGNRFIKLWWANRDRISSEEGGTLPKKFYQSSSKGELSLPSKRHGYERDEGATSVATIESRPPSLAGPSVITGPGKDSLASSPKTTISVQKKMVNLELLEEIRKKQEILAQKRDEFRQQLDKFEKQAVSVKKAEDSCEQANKRCERDLSNEETKPVTPRKVNVGSTEAISEHVKLQKSNSREVLISPTSKSAVVQNSTIMQTSHLPGPLMSRFKLDNRPTTFRILPPLPAGFAEVAVLKDHFSSYGDLSSVVLEDPEAGSANEGVNPLEHQSAFIAFQMTDSAERAYLGGKFWQGHSMHFMWLPVSQSKSGSGIQVFSDCSRSLAGKNQTEHAACEPSSLPAENSFNSGIISCPTTKGESTVRQVISYLSGDATKSLSNVPCTGSKCINMQLCEEPHCISNNPS